MHSSFISTFEEFQKKKICKFHENLYTFKKKKIFYNCKVSYENETKFNYSK